MVRPKSTTTGPTRENQEKTLNVLKTRKLLGAWLSFWKSLMRGRGMGKSGVWSP
jgi:hypothetical protein